MGGCQNYDPFLGTLKIRCCIIIGIQKGTSMFDNHPHGISETPCEKHSSLERAFCGLPRLRAWQEPVHEAPKP